MKTTLITGANRGLGLEFAKQLKEKGYYVIACCRNPDSADELRQWSDEIIALDVTSDEDIEQLVQKLRNKPIDLLINNAGISGQQGVTLGHIERANFMQVMEVNCLSVLKLSDALLPNLQASQDKGILVISSTMGSIAENENGQSFAYRSSKAALNCAMRSFAIDAKPSGIHVMLMHPGWVKTDMGGDNALIDAQTSVSGILTQVEQLMPSSHAQIFHRYDGGTIPW